MENASLTMYPSVSLDRRGGRRGERGRAAMIMKEKKRYNGLLDAYKAKDAAGVIFICFSNLKGGKNVEKRGEEGGRVG